MRKKNTPPTPSTNLPALKIGSRVRFGDGACGRITWANAVSVKIKWDDGEEITWRRDSLSWRPIEILDTDADTAEQQPKAQDTNASEPAATAVVSAVPAAAEVVRPAAEAAATVLEAPVPEQTDSQSPAAEQTVPVTEPVPSPEPAPAPETTPAEVGSQEPHSSWEANLEAARQDPNDLASETQHATPAAKPKRERKAKTPPEPKEKKMSALDAAARVLAEAGQAMTCKEMIGAMAIKGYWTSPGGKTPDATLCSAILREIKEKGDQSRFVKVGPGRFAFRPTV